MRKSGTIEKWATGLLGVVCLVLVLNLVFRSGVRAGALRPAEGPAAPRGSKNTPARAADDLARYDPAVRLDLFAELQARALPKLPRNPFEFEARPVAVGTAEAGGPTTPPPPPPPPPPPFKALGYTEKPGGIREAIISDEDQVLVIHEGETLRQQYRVTKISPAAIEMEDATLQRTIRLPVPQ
jgi:hypothetical protein